MSSYFVSNRGKFSFYEISIPICPYTQENITRYVDEEYENLYLSDTKTLSSICCTSKTTILLIPCILIKYILCINIICRR